MRCDVVLVDTAGRMQDNEPLMRSLAKVCFFSTDEYICYYLILEFLGRLICNLPLCFLKTPFHAKNKS